MYQFRYVFIFASVIVISPLVQAGAQSEKRTGVLKGKVKERKGKNLEGVMVRATRANVADGDAETHETKSNEKGDFEFDALPAGQYSLSFEKKGFKTFLTRKQEITSGVVTRLSRTVELAPEEDPYAVIRGAVFYGSGFTLPNASVVIERIDGGKKFKQEKVSVEGGEFSFRLKAEKAKYRITATARGFDPASIEVEIEGDEARNVALTLQRSR